MSSLLNNRLLTEPSTDLFVLLMERTMCIIAIVGLIYSLLKIIESWKTDAKNRKSSIAIYLFFSLLLVYLTVDSAKAFTVSSKPSPTLLDIADKISVEGNRVTIAPIKDEYPTYQYTKRLKETNVITLTFNENKDDEEESTLVDWKSDEYSLSKEEYEMLKAKRHS